MIKHRNKVSALLALLALAAGAWFSLDQRTSTDTLIHREALDTAVRPTNVLASPTQQPVTTLATTAVPPRESVEAKVIGTPTYILGPTKSPVRTHVIAAGETLTAIADRYQTTVALLQTLNGLVDPHTLLVGQTVVVPELATESGELEMVGVDGAFERSAIGESTNGHPLYSYRKGDGRYHALVIAAIHGGYEWNTALLAYRLLTHYSVFPDRIPDDVTLHIVPIANPDGMVAVTGQNGPFMAANVSGDTTIGRLNGNAVDLNRNWGCDWSAEGRWRQMNVSGGSRPFSEPETRALRDYIINLKPQVVVWLHSAAGLVVPGNCQGINHESSSQAAALYASGSGYPVGQFNVYQVTGDAADWLAQHKIASITIELTDHQGLDFAQNLAGLTSLFQGVETLSGD